MEFRNTLQSRPVETNVANSKLKRSISQPVHQQTKRPKALVTQQSLSSGTRAMTTRSSSVVSVPVYPEIERPKMRAKHSRNIKDVCYPTFLRIKCDKKHFPVMKSSCETVKGIMTICSHDIKCSPVLLNEQLLNMTSSKSFHIFTTKECFPYFRDVASNDSNAFSKDELVDTLQTTSEFALIVGEDSMQTTICDVLQKLNAHIPVAGLVVTIKESAHQSPDLPNVIFDTTVSDTIMKKADSLLNRCVHRILTVLYGKLAEAPFDSDDNVIVFDVCDMIKSSFQRNMIPEMECPKIPEQGFSYPHNIDKVIDNILREEAVMGCLKKHATLYIYLTSLTQRSDIEKKIQDLMVNLGVIEFEPVFKYVTMEHLFSSGDWACNGTLGGFAMKHSNVTSELNDHNLVALISQHVAKNTNEQFLLVGQNQTNLGSLDGMNYVEDMDIYPVMVDPNQKMNCDTNFRTEDDNAMQSKLRSTKEIEILNGSIVHIWGHKTSPGLGIVVEKPLKTPNGKILFVRDRNHEHSFAEPGDSGAMVCYYDPKVEVLYAVGMLIGRCKSNGAVSSGRYAAQVLDDGLRELSKINEFLLQCRSVDVVKAMLEVSVVQDAIQDIRTNIDTYHQLWFIEATTIAAKLNVQPSTTPRTCGRQTKWDNIEAGTPEDYYKRTLTIQFVNTFLSEMNTRFSELHLKAAMGLKVIPDNLCNSKTTITASDFDWFKEDLPSPQSLPSELHMWQAKWRGISDRPTTMQDSLKHCDVQLYPNMRTVLEISCVFPVTACECERTISALGLVKSKLRSSMGKIDCLHCAYSPFTGILTST